MRYKSFVLVALLSTEFKYLRISLGTWHVYVGIQTGFHNEEQLFHVVGSEAPPLEVTARSALFFTVHHKSPMTCPYL